MSMLVNAAAVQAASALPALNSTSSNIEIDGGKLLSSLRPILRGMGRPARIYYLSKSCTSESVPFPPLDVRRPAGAGLNGLRELFQDDKNVHVEDDDGMVRITIGDPPKQILRTRISKLKFYNYARYQPTLALGAIYAGKDVRAAGRRLGVRQPFRNVLMGLNRMDERRPHLPEAMVHVTMDEALDRVAKTFGGIVVYGACARPPRYVVDFVEVVPLD